MKKQTIAAGLLAAVISTFSYVQTVRADDKGDSIANSNTEATSTNQQVAEPVKAAGETVQKALDAFAINDKRLPRSPLSLVLVPGRSIYQGINGSLTGAAKGGALLRNLDGQKPTFPEAVVGKVIYTPLGFVIGAVNSVKYDLKTVASTSDAEL